MLDILSASFHIDTRPLLVKRQADFFLNLVNCFTGGDGLTDRGSQLNKISALLANHPLVTHFTMSGGHDFYGQFFHLIQHGNPAFRVTVSRVIKSAIHTGIAGKEDLLFWQPGDCIAERVGMTKVDQFDPLRSIIENKFIAKIK
mgnify:CR=1 FL=1